MRAIQVLAALAVMLSAAPPVVPGRAQARTPPTSVQYRVQALDQETGRPVAGVWIEAAERKRVFRCYGYDCGTPCQELEESTVGWVSTGADGIGLAVFHLNWCELWDDDPMTWVKEIHAGWAPPRLVDDAAVGIDNPCVFVSWAPGSGEIDQVVRVTAKADLAEQFAPVLHRHAGYELQEDLGDIEETVEGHAELEAFGVGGQRIYGPAVPPPLHVWDQWHWDSFGWGQTAAYWRLDIDDAWRHAGAAPGRRPLYCHVLPYSDGAVLQYWLWFNANDLTSQWGFAEHEGDWEYAAVRVRFDGAGWVPVGVNLSRHRGGVSLLPSECWWSESRAPGYAGMALGFSPPRSHPHVWVASNSHALYNRFEPTYTLDLDGLGLCGGVYSDAVDYNLSDNPAGSHGFFPFERLVLTGEIWHAGRAHGYTWFDHLEGGWVPSLRFYGRFGTGNCDAPPGCADALCSMIAAWDGGTYQLAPRSPVIPEEPHRWSGFVETPGRWGNSGDRVSFQAHPPRRCYLGWYQTASDGGGDAVAFQVPAGHPDRPGVARVVPVTGNVRFLGADEAGEIALGPAVNGAYRFCQSRVEGKGRSRIDIYPQGMTGQPDAEELWVDVEPVGDPTSGAVPGSCRGDGRAQVSVSPTPCAGPVRIRLSAAAPGARRIRVCDVAGREVWSSAADPGQTELIWDGRGRDGAVVASGVYLVHEDAPGRPSRTGRVLVVR